MMQVDADFGERLPSALHHYPTPYALPWTLDPGPWTLDPGPWTLDPTPVTLHPVTLHPVTLHPNPKRVAPDH